MRYGVKYMEKPEDYPEAWAAMAYELGLRYEDYALHGYPREDAAALMHVLLRFGWRPSDKAELIEAIREHCDTVMPRDGSKVSMSEIAASCEALWQVASSRSGDSA
jgi:hypothetical protein